MPQATPKQFHVVCRECEFESLETSRSTATEAVADHHEHSGHDVVFKQVQ